MAQDSITLHRPTQTLFGIIHKSLYNPICTVPSIIACFHGEKYTANKNTTKNDGTVTVVVTF